MFCIGIVRSGILELLTSFIFYYWFFFLVDPFSHPFSFGFSFFFWLGRPLFPSFQGPLCFFFRDDTHPSKVWVFGFVTIEEAWILKERFDGPANQLDLCASDWIVECVLKFRHPAKVFWAIVTSININMVSYIPIPNRFAMVSRADDSMNTFLPDEHITRVRVEFAESPLLVPFARLSIFLALTIHGPIVANIIAAAFVFADSFFSEYSYQILPFHTILL